MSKDKKQPQYKLDSEEEKILASFECGEWETVDDAENQKKIARKVAANTLRKDVRINLRLSSLDLSKIKQLAEYEGLPYQTLMASILHKYAAGHLHG